MLEKDEIIWQNEVLEMAKLAGFEMDNSCVISPQNLWYIYQEQLETFAKLVAAKEQSRCCSIIYGMCGSDNVAERTVKAIRARGKA